MKILYLYAEVMGYTMATISALAERGAEVHVVHWDKQKHTPYQPTKLSNVYMYNRSELTTVDIQSLADKISPAATVVSGWMDKGYLTVARKLRVKGAHVVVGFDGQWYGNARQRVAAFLGAIGYFSRYFSHAWVAGPYQYEYARRLGFKKGNIVYDLYSADLNLFNKAYLDNLESKKNNYPHRFLFVGRLESIKGLYVLLQAWKILGEDRLDWDLHLIGSGSLNSELKDVSGLVVKDFMQPENLMREVANAGCFILPSRKEPWGVVVHEFAASGLPLILSDVVGAAKTFLISGVNGFSFEANNPEALAMRMSQIINMPDPEIRDMAANSHRLSQRTTPETSAANLLSIINE
jgi:glycosyltransferase involved in cell wall biosynthesis